ncbi:hypothetical protein PHISP_01612 [Aspergillus sp. HF37]|nr:hypothetical protein PHISP_01612 [Aspergillus sp. HF37]
MHLDPKSADLPNHDLRVLLFEKPDTRKAYTKYFSAGTGGLFSEHLSKVLERDDQGRLLAPEKNYKRTLGNGWRLRLQFMDDPNTYTTKGVKRRKNLESNNQSNSPTLTKTKRAKTMTIATPSEPVTENQIWRGDFLPIGTVPAREVNDYRNSSIQFHKNLLDEKNLETEKNKDLRSRLESAQTEIAIPQSHTGTADDTLARLQVAETEMVTLQSRVDEAERCSGKDREIAEMANRDSEKLLDKVRLLEEQAKSQESPDPKTQVSTTSASTTPASVISTENCKMKIKIQGAIHACDQKDDKVSIPAVGDLREFTIRKRD